MFSIFSIFFYFIFSYFIYSNFYLYICIYMSCHITSPCFQIFWCLYLLIFLSPHLHIFMFSHSLIHIFFFSFIHSAVSFCPLAFRLVYFFSNSRGKNNANETERNATLSHEAKLNTGWSQEENYPSPTNYIKWKHKKIVKDWIGFGAAHWLRWQRNVRLNLFSVQSFVCKSFSV